MKYIYLIALSVLTACGGSSTNQQAGPPQTHSEYQKAVTDQKIQEHKSETKEVDIREYEVKHFKELLALSNMRVEPVEELQKTGLFKKELVTVGYMFTGEITNNCKEVDFNEIEIKLTYKDANGDIISTDKVFIGDIVPAQKNLFVTAPVNRKPEGPHFKAEIISATETTYD
jgi:hypothetical protein